MDEPNLLGCPCFTVSRDGLFCNLSTPGRWQLPWVPAVDQRDFMGDPFGITAKMVFLMQRVAIAMFTCGGWQMKPTPWLFLSWLLPQLNKETTNGKSRLTLFIFVHFSIYRFHSDIRFYIGWYVLIMIIFKLTIIAVVLAWLVLQTDCLTTLILLIPDCSYFIFTDYNSLILTIFENSSRTVGSNFSKWINHRLPSAFLIAMLRPWLRHLQRPLAAFPKRWIGVQTPLWRERQQAIARSKALQPPPPFLGGWGLGPFFSASWDRLRVSWSAGQLFAGTWDD